MCAQCLSLFHKLNGGGGLFTAPGYPLLLGLGSHATRSPWPRRLELFPECYLLGLPLRLCRYESGRKRNNLCTQKVGNRKYIGVEFGREYYIENLFVGVQLRSYCTKDQDFISFRGIGCFRPKVAVRMDEKATIEVYICFKSS